MSHAEYCRRHSRIRRVVQGVVDSLGGRTERGPALRGARNLALRVSLSVVALLVGSPVSRGDDGVVLGASLPLSSPGVIVNGAALRDGLLAAARQINERGGVGGVKVRIRVLDDGGDPEQAARNATALLRDPDVVALVSCFGEASCLAIAQVADRDGAAFVGPAAGDPALCGKQGLAHCIRGDFGAEADRICREFRTVGIDELVVLTGQAYHRFRQGVTEVVRRCGLRVAEVRASTSGTDEWGLSAHSETTGFVVLGGTADAVALVAAVRRHRPSAPVAVMSSAHLFEWLQQIRGARGVLVTHGVPDPDKPTLLIVREYQAAMDSFVSAYSHEQFEAYEATRLIASVLSSSGGVSRSGLRAALARTDRVDLGGIRSR